MYILQLIGFICCRDGKSVGGSFDWCYQRPRIVSLVGLFLSFLFCWGNVTIQCVRYSTLWSGTWKSYFSYIDCVHMPPFYSQILNHCYGVSISELWNWNWSKNKPTRFWALESCMLIFAPILKLWIGFPNAAYIKHLILIWLDLKHCLDKIFYVASDWNKRKLTSSDLWWLCPK